jgi:hypothetical protein
VCLLSTPLPGLAVLSTNQLRNASEPHRLIWVPRSHLKSPSR